MHYSDLCKKYYCEECFEVVTFLGKSWTPKKFFAKNQNLVANSNPSILQIHEKFYNSHFFWSKNDGKFYSFHFFLVKSSMIFSLVSLSMRF